MASIVSGILSLTQHLIPLEENQEKYCLENCPNPNCGKSGLWRHGFRYRKSYRENNDQTSSLNPIPILRLYCPACGRTFLCYLSALHPCAGTYGASSKRR